jgi:hypothetical protein
LRPRQGAPARSKNFFLLVSHVLHQNETTAEWQDPKIKFSLKIKSPYCTVHTVITRFCHNLYYARYHLHRALFY